MDSDVGSHWVQRLLVPGKADVDDGSDRRQPSSPTTAAPVVRCVNVETAMHAPAFRVERTRWRMVLITADGSLGQDGQKWRTGTVQECIVSRNATHGVRRPKESDVQLQPRPAATRALTVVPVQLIVSADTAASRKTGPNPLVPFPRHLGKPASITI
ncbi:predicted protein [Postia placenta Mad-698-R]|nr:predicted protein [Postia placenta Mad-698-R]